MHCFVGYRSACCWLLNREREFPGEEQDTMKKLSTQNSVLSVLVLKHLSHKTVCLGIGGC